MPEIYQQVAMFDKIQLQLRVLFQSITQNFILIFNFADLCLKYTSKSLFLRGFNYNFIEQVVPDQLRNHTYMHEYTMRTNCVYWND